MARSVDVDGTHFTASLGATATLISNDLGIMGGDSTGKEIGIAIVNPTVGTFAIAATNPVSIEYNDAMSAWKASENGGSGSVIITMFTASEVVGTFSGMLVPQGSATGTPMLANGIFDVSY